MLKIKNVLKATTENIIVAFLYTIIFLSVINYFFGANLKEISKTINLISITPNTSTLSDIKLDLESHNLTSYPEYGTKYATLNIPSLDINLPVFYGDTLSIIKYGIGHSSGSYFPGEGGSILYMGHNTKGMLYELKNILNDALIVVNTNYGVYTYKVYNTKIIDYQNLEEVPINRNEEILMLYTCFETGTIGLTTKRFVVYAKLEYSEIKGLENEKRDNTPYY